MTKYLYPIFQTSGKNGCSDLNIAMAMFLSDAREGVQKYGPDGVDYVRLHADYEALSAAQKELRAFIANHYKALVNAWKSGARQEFEEMVAQCAASDAAKAAGQQAQQPQE